MNAAVDELEAEAVASAAPAPAAARPVVAAATSAAAAAAPVATGAPGAPVTPFTLIDEPSIARAMHEAQRANRPALEVLAQTSGLAGDRYARALAHAFDYRFVSSGELAQLEPDFSILPPAEATRRHCVVVHEGERLLAVFTDPFDETLRGWPGRRIGARLEWGPAPRGGLANLTPRRAESLPALDTGLRETEEPARAPGGAANPSSVR